MPYIPEHRFQGDLYSNLGEFVILETNQPYEGSYHKLSSGKYFTGATPYITGSNLKVWANTTVALIDDSFLLGDKLYVEIRELHSYPETTNNVFYGEDDNQGLYLTVVGADFTAGDGTLIAKIYHKTNTFGA